MEGSTKFCIAHGEEELWLTAFTKELQQLLTKANTATTNMKLNLPS